MIGKVTKPGKGFKGLIRYLLHGDRKKARDPNRVAWCEARNLIIDDPEKVPALMRATAARSKRVKKPVYHYVVSWHRDEAPTDAIMRQVANTTCKDLGLAEYQALYIAHNDTEHRHVHIVVNRVHPETHLAWKTSHDYRRIEQSLRRQSEDMGLDYVPGPHNDPERFYGARRAKDPAFQRAKRLGRPLQPLQAPSQEKARAFLLVYQQATSWAQFEAGLGALGLRLEAKGQGAVVIDGEQSYKLSVFGKTTRLKDLQGRFGERLVDFRQDSLPDTEPELRNARNRVELARILRRADLIDDAQLERHLRHQDERAVALRPRSREPQQGKVAAKQQDYLAYQEAASVADLAFALYNIGLIDRSQLARATREHEFAHAVLDKHKSTVDQLIDDATKALFGSPAEQVEAQRRLAARQTKRRAYEPTSEQDEPEL